MAIKTALEHYRLTFKEHLIANAILLLSTFYFAKATSYLFPTGFDYKSDLNILHMYIQFPPPPGQEMFHKDCIFLTLYTYDHYFPLFRFFLFSNVFHILASFFWFIHICRLPHICIVPKTHCSSSLLPLENTHQWVAKESISVRDGLEALKPWPGMLAPGPPSDQGQNTCFYLSLCQAQIVMVPALQVCCGD